MTEEFNTVVSIVLPTYNRASLLEKSVNSILEQSYQYWELIIINNESTDYTERLIRSFSEKDKRIRYFEVNKSLQGGISQYLNFGIHNSLGKYIARIDDDDTWSDRDKLKKQVDFLDANPNYVICGGGVMMVNSAGREMYRFLKNETNEEIRRKALMACPFEHTTIMFLKDAAIIVGLYKNYRVCEDWDFFLRLGLIGKFYNFNCHFANYLQSGVNISLNDQSLVAKTELKIIREYKKYYPNYFAGMTIHIIQYLYSFFPEILKNRIQYFLRYIKRKFL